MTPIPRPCDQILRRLAPELQSLQSECSAMALVIRAAVETHPDIPGLAARIGELLMLKESLDQGTPLSDETIESRRSAAERWQVWIASAE